MKTLTIEEANIYLAEIGFEIGYWNRVRLKNDATRNNLFSIEYTAPKNGLELLNFSQHVAGWLPRGKWKLFNFDNSTVLDVADRDFVNKFVNGNLRRIENEYQPLLFEFGNNMSNNVANELSISNLIFGALLLECHGYLVSSDNQFSQFISIQDGSVEFLSSSENICDANKLLENFARHPLRQPEWITSYEY